MGFLDLTGLTTFWNNVKDYIDDHKATVTQTLTSGTEIGSVDGTKLYAPAASSGGSQTTWYGTSSTAASTAAKTTSITDFELVKGAMVSVYFSTANTAATPTLNVSGTGAKQIRARNAAGSTANPIKWAAKTTLTFVYTGSYWFLVAEDTSGWRQVSVTTSAVPSGFNTRDVRVWANDRLRLLYVYIHYENTGGSNTATGSNTALFTCTDTSLYPSSTKACLEGFRYNGSTGALADFPVRIYQVSTTAKSWGMQLPGWSFDAASFKTHGTIPYDALGIA
jgi:hypothetical protein